MNQTKTQKSVLPSLCRAFGHREGRQKGGSAREWRYTCLQVKLILISLLFFLSCSAEYPEEGVYFEAGISLEKIHSWEIGDIGLIPNPYYSGVLEDHSLVIIDRSLNTINHFDEEGNLINVFGGVGRGPGEYSSITHAAVNPDGQVAVADISNARITIQDVNIHTPESLDLDIGWHTRLSWISEGLIITNNPFRIGNEYRGGSIPGDIIMRIYDPVTGSKEQFFHLELELEDLPPDQISCTFCEFRFMDDFTFFTSPQDTSYRIYKMDPSTHETALFTLPGVPAVRLTEPEREEWRNERLQASELTGVAMENEPPTHKRRFIDFFPDHEGRLWVWMNVHADEPSRFDIFSPDGEYAGSLKPPDDIESIQFISGDKILFRYNPDDGDDVWRAGLYKVQEQAH